MEDRLAELGKNRQHLLRALGCNKIWLSRIISHPQKASAAQMVAMAEVLEVEDWYEDLFKAFGMATETALATEIDKLLHAEGYTLDKVVNVAA